MKHEDLLELGFRLYGVEENDTYYSIFFKYPLKFDVSSLVGILENDCFLLYDNNTIYSDINELKKVIEVVGGVIYYPKTYKD